MFGAIGFCPHAIDVLTAICADFNFTRLLQLRLCLSSRPTLSPSLSLSLSLPPSLSLSCSPSLLPLLFPLLLLSHSPPRPVVPRTISSLPSFPQVVFPATPNKESVQTAVQTAKRNAEVAAEEHHKVLIVVSQ